VVGSELARLDFGLEFHTIPLCFSWVILLGHELTSRCSDVPSTGLANDGIVVGGQLSSLDSGLEFHTILPSSQQPHRTLPPLLR
jgi:hypothetical protein